MAGVSSFTRADDIPPMLELTTLFILSSLALFLIGILGGWVISVKDNSTRKTKKTNLRLIIALLVTIVWVISIAAEIIIPTYTVSALIHGIMGAVVGYLFSDDGITFNIGDNNQE